MEAKEFEPLLNDLETRVDRLRALYENWFRGYEKTEPQVARKDVERRVYALRKELPRNTALRFRYHQLYLRYTTLANYWHRTAKQIEEGTYRLQVARMRRKGAVHATGRERSRDSQPPGPRSYELDLNESLSVDDLLNDHEMDEVARAVDSPASEPPAPAPKPRAEPPTPLVRPAPAPTQAVPAAYKAAPVVRPMPPAPAVPAPAPAVAAASQQQPSPAPAPAFAKPTPSATFRMPAGALPVRPAPPTSTTTGVAAKPQPTAGSAARDSGLPNEERLKRIYDEYTSARKRNNEGEVRFDHLVSSIQKMLPDLQKKHQGKRIDFEVVVKDGRVGLKPRAT